jgi:uncharacterized YigZ family protein
MEASDTFRTIKRPFGPSLYKAKKSKFYGYALPVQSDTQIKPILEDLRKSHTGANHVCYAWIIGARKPSTRDSDDGEPANSAGKPILRKIEAAGLTNILVGVVRVFGGTKLGVRGLIDAYGTAALMAIEQSEQIQKTIQKTYELLFPYENLNAVMKLIKKNQINITYQELELNCSIEVTFRESKEEEILEQFAKIRQLVVKEQTLS